MSASQAIGVVAGTIHVRQALASVSFDNFRGIVLGAEDPSEYISPGEVPDYKDPPTTYTVIVHEKLPFGKREQVP